MSNLFVAPLVGGDARLPHWTGYTLGFWRVADCQARTRRSAAELVKTPAEAFRPE